MAVAAETVRADEDEEFHRIVAGFYEPSPTGSTLEEVLSPLHPGIHEAYGFIDREAVEAQARYLIAQRDRLPPVEVKTQERRDNARTALMEALTASGHESTVELHGTFDEINAQVLRRLLNGWDDTLPQHELLRRFAEICNELVIQSVQGGMLKGELPPDTEVMELSNWGEGVRGLGIGYRDSNRKGMVRSTGLLDKGDNQYTRIIRQVSRSNSDDASSVAFLMSSGIRVPEYLPRDVAVLSAPGIYSRSDYADAVIDVTRMLDWHAGPGVLYGDHGPRTDKHPLYEDLRAESMRREQEIESFVGDLAALEEQLDGWIENGSITYQDRMVIYKEEVARILDAICTLDPGYAEDTFGIRSVPIFEKAALLEAQGYRDEARRLLIENEYLKDAVTFCGVTISIEEAKAKGLKVNEYGELVEKGKENWSWKPGTSRVKSCPKPQPTEVGPCSVCRHCQAEFDKGRDPTKRSAGRLRKLGKAAIGTLGRLFSPKRHEAKPQPAAESSP